MMPRACFAVLVTLVVALIPELANALSSPAVNNNNINTNCRHVDCAIIGGGPAGLATAIALLKASPSSSVAIFERDGFQPKGASIQISTSGWKSVRKLDTDGSLVEKLRETGSPVTAVEIRPWKTSSRRRGLLTVVKSVLFKTVLRLVSFVFRKMGKALNITHLWHDVRVVLRDYAEGMGVTPANTNTNTNTAGVGTSDDDGINDELDRERRKDKSLVSLHSNLENIQLDENADKGKEQFHLTFRHTQTDELTTVKAKFLFACDGVNSRVRNILPNEPDILLSENKSVWRGMAPIISTSGKSIFYQSDATDSSTAGRSALIFPGGKNAGSSWTVLSPVQDESKSLSDEEARRRVLDVIGTMGTNNNDDYDLLKRAIDNSPIIIENKLHVRDFEQPWESAYDGLIYVGDSAHPVRPTGEGTALALEDAVVLSEVIVRNKNGLCVGALRDYESERYEPVKKISEQIRARAEAFYEGGNVDLNRR